MREDVWSVRLNKLQCARIPEMGGRRHATISPTGQKRCHALMTLVRVEVERNSSIATEGTCFKHRLGF